MREYIERISAETAARIKELRKAQYKCQVCSGINHKQGYYETDSQFCNADEFQLKWAKTQGLKIVRISLQIVWGIFENSHPNYTKCAVLCRKHAMELKNKQRAWRKSI